MIMYDNDNNYGVTAYPKRPGWVVTLDKIKTNEMVVTKVIKEVEDTDIWGYDEIVFNDEFELIHRDGVYTIRPRLPYIGTKNVSEYVNIINTFRYRDRYKTATKLYIIFGEFIQKNYIWEMVGIGRFRWNGKDVKKEVPMDSLTKKVRDMIPVTEEKDWVDLGLDYKGRVLVTMNEYPVFILIDDKYDGLIVSLNRVIIGRAIMAGVKTKPLIE